MAEPITTEWLSIKGATKRVKLGYDTVYDAVRSGELRAFQRGEGSAWRIRVEDLDSWLMGTKGDNP